MGEPLSMDGRHAVDGAALSENAFYRSYKWCLNPVLSLRDLFRHLREEMDRYGSLGVDWQREEARINLWILACAIACTVDDYLVRRPWDFSSIGRRFSRLRVPAAFLEWLLNWPNSLRVIFSDRAVRRWRLSWHECMDQVCDLLMSPREARSQQWADLRATVQTLTDTQFPERLRRRRMRLPQGFRCQDLTHHDVFTLAQRFGATQPDRSRRVAVIGLRTAGAYAAPLVRASLSALGWSFVSWTTIRPKLGVSRREGKRLRIMLREAARVLVVDDYQETGHTVRLTLSLLKRFGVPPERVVLLVPSHAIHPDWNQLHSTAPQLTLITLEAADLRKEELLDPRYVEPLLQDYLGDGDRARVCIEERDDVDAINARLWAHYPDGFHVRLKRVFQVRISGHRRTPVVRRIIAKSVGWGWLGYHAYIAGTRLAGFVPPVVGLRNGFLFSEWLDDGGPSHEKLAGPDDLLETLSTYIGRRVRRLRLQGDPSHEAPGYRWTGWDEIMQMLRGIYGPYLGRLKAAALHGHLRQSACPVPTLIDGRMTPDNLLSTTTGTYKVDFEHHNFGGAELDLVDPAYDLASCVFEWQLSEEAEQTLLQAYARESGDRGIFDRILLYKLLYGLRAMKNAGLGIARSPSRDRQEAWNQRAIAARTFLILQLSRFCAALIPRRERPQWSRRLFFLDLDGVLDYEYLGFPHTTASGLTALDLLRSQGFSVIPNTGRSVEQVRHYCQTYALPGGVGEYGSVLVDAVQRRDVVFVDAEAMEQIRRCRERIRKIPGVFIDPEYHYSIRAYRYDGRGMVGLSKGEMEGVLAEAGCDRLASIADTYIVQKGIDKGSGLLATKRYLGLESEAAFAIGDSDQDVAMLRAADLAYAPANCSSGVRELVRGGRCRLMNRPLQKGLLAAVGDVLRRDSAVDCRRPLAKTVLKNSGNPITDLLRVAERSRLGQYIAVLSWWSL